MFYCIKRNTSEHIYFLNRTLYLIIFRYLVGSLKDSILKSKFSDAVSMYMFLQCCCLNCF